MYRLSKHLLDEMKAHALEAFPEECCGFLLFDVENEVELIRRVRNVATERHQKDPKSFPRDGRDSYVMDEKELLDLQNGMDAGTFELRAIYHSHPNGKAYFSKEDEARAKMWDEPIYPEAIYIILGTDGHAITGTVGALWNEDRLEYEDVAIGRA